MQRNRTEEAKRRAEERAERRKKVAIVIKRLIGDRSIRKTAADTGVTAAYLSGILNEKYLPSREVLEKLADPGNMPQNDVTLNELLVAAGYISKAESSEKSEIEMYMILNSGKCGLDQGRNQGRAQVQDQDQDQDQVQIELALQENERGMEHLQAYYKRLNARAQFSSLANAVIYTALIRKGLFDEELKDISADVKGVDFGIRITDSQTGTMTGAKNENKQKNQRSKVEEWWFILGYYDEEAKEDPAWIRGWFLNALFVEKDPRRKISVVTNSEKAFNHMLDYKGKMAYQGELSVILIDTESISVKDEVYLSHYSECDPEKASEYEVLLTL